MAFVKRRQENIIISVIKKYFIAVVKGLGVFEMKQTDKCECGHIKQMHIIRKGHNNDSCWEFKDEKKKDICNCKEFKSHSQDLSSSVPYTPLTKNKIYSAVSFCEECMEDDIIKKEDVLSALNGLRDDLCPNEKHSNSCYICNKINKWFPIVDEGKKE